MLTDTALRNCRPKSKIYKASDCDGMYVMASPTGTVAFRFDYRQTFPKNVFTTACPVADACRGCWG